MSGRAQAHQDIAADRIRLLEAGTEAVCTPAIPFGDQRYAALPRHTLPVGCTTPNAGAWMQYAEGYNRVMIAHLEGRIPRERQQHSAAERR